MSSSEQLIRQLREKRMSWVDLPDGKAVRIIRPPEREIFINLYKGTSVLVGFDEACRYTVDWRGFTEADVLGAAVGAADAVPFTPELWTALAADNTQWAQAVQQALLDVAMAYLQTTQADAKN